MPNNRSSYYIGGTAVTTKISLSKIDIRYVSYLKLIKSFNINDTRTAKV